VGLGTVRVPVLTDPTEWLHVRWIDT